MHVHVGLIILAPIFTCLLIYFLVLIVDSLFPKPNIQINPIHRNNIVRNITPNIFPVRNKIKGDVANKKKNFHVPKFMLELYENNKIEGKKIEAPDVVRSLIPTHAGLIENNEIFETPSENHILVFDLPSSDRDETFLSAELKILTLVIFDERNDTGIKRILKMSIYDDSSMTNLLGFREVPIYHTNNTWISFNMTAPVHDILKSTTRNKFLSIMITVSAILPDTRGTLKLSLTPEKENFEFNYPVLLLSYTSTKQYQQPKDFMFPVREIRKNRIKRSLEDDYEEETNKLWDDDGVTKKYLPKKLRRLKNSCKRKALYVDFAEINYDSWIVQPEGYEAYQCFGRCFYPVAEHLNPTKHAIVQALLHSVAPSRVSRSCCVPTSLDSISILYVDINGVLTYRYAYKDMVVVECGCR